MVIAPLQPQENKEEVRHKPTAHTSLRHFFLFLVHGGKTLSLAVKRKSTPQTRAGQYMCPECGKIFNTKKQVNKHLYENHEDHLRIDHGTVV